MIKHSSFPFSLPEAYADLSEALLLITGDAEADRISLHLEPLDDGVVRFNLCANPADAEVIRLKLLKISFVLNPLKYRHISIQRLLSDALGKENPEVGASMLTRALAMRMTKWEVLILVRRSLFNDYSALKR